MNMDEVLIFLVCFRSLVHSGTLLTILDYLDGKGQVRGSELNAPVPGGVTELCVLDGVPADKSLMGQKPSTKETGFGM